MWLGGIKAGFYELLELLLPDTCLQCRTLSGQLCCNACLASIPVRVHQGRCLEGLDLVTSFLPYEGLVQRLFQEYKLDGYSRLGPLISTVLLPHFFKGVDGPVVCVPIPTHFKRIKTRGFNHIDLLFEPLLASVGHHFSDVICRVKETPPLYGLSKVERETVLNEVFAPVDPEFKFRGQDVLLCDDILTSGSTLRHCAKLCRALGAGRVMAVTIAEVYDQD